MEDNLNLRGVVHALRRRWLLIALPTAIGGALSVAAAMLLPPVYSATARILVESQQIPSDLARSTVAVNAEEQIRSIEQRLTTRQNLLDLAERHQVFANRGELSPTDIVTRMRQATRIQSVGGDRRGSRGDTTVSLIEISFKAGRATTAAQVANDFLTQVLEQNVQARSARASETLEFFSSEVDRLAAALRDFEARISAFKTENAPALPENLEFRRSELASLQREALSRQSRRLTLEEAKRALEEAIALGQSAASGPDRSPGAAELARLRAQLAQNRAVYAETHPAIRSLVAQISALEASAGAGSAEAEAGEGPVPGQATDALRQIERIEAELAMLDGQELSDRDRAVALEATIARAPEVEIALSALRRDYDALQVQYQGALAKRAEAATGERLEVNQQAERFEVIEQPQTPDRPISPNRPLIAGAGGVLSLGLGLALAILAELLNPALRTARDMERQLELRPIVTIPYVFTERELFRRRWINRSALVGLLIVLPLGLLAVDRLYRPLPVLFEQAIQRTGFGEALTVIRQRLTER